MIRIGEAHFIGVFHDRDRVGAVAWIREEFHRKAAIKGVVYDEIRFHDMPRSFVNGEARVVSTQ